MTKVIRRPGGIRATVSTTPDASADPDLAAMTPSPRVVTSKDVIIGARARQHAGLLPLDVLHKEPVSEAVHYGGGSASGGTSSRIGHRRRKD